MSHPAHRSRPGDDIRESTRRYESWLRGQTLVVEADLRRKHAEMTSSPHTFLRATYYRWAEHWPRACADLAGAPVVTAVADLHLENFGTWRDAEGRLAWGVNDFDEAAPLAYTSDLVRLATSAALAHREGRLQSSPKKFCGELLRAYGEALSQGGRPVLFAEDHRDFGERVVECLLDPRSFWTKKLGSALRPRPPAPPTCRRVLEEALPRDARGRAEIRARMAGVGSLGRPRFVAVVAWGGGRLAREAKALVPSAARPPLGRLSFASTLRCLERLLRGAVRSPDPFLGVRSGWLVRRLAPDSDKIRLDRLGGLEAQLVSLMGAEVANVHLATPRAAGAIRHDLARRKSGWLSSAAERMSDLVERDYEDWRRR
jgi:hypothetical protein